MKAKKKKILITGSSGFIGSHLLPSLMKSYNVIGVSKFFVGNEPKYSKIKCDISSTKFSGISTKIDGVIHLAAITDVQFCEKFPEKCFKTNVLGTLKALELARKNDVKFLYLSTAHVYGRPKNNPIKENNPTNPLSIYSASKLAAENCCEGYHNAYGMDISIIRLFSVYGPNTPSHLVSSRIISQLKNSSIRIGNLKTKRDFIYISDAIKAIKLVFQKSKGFQIYNVGSGKSTSILELCNLCRKISKSNIPVISVEKYSRKNDVNKIVANISKIKNLGWRPSTSIQHGLKSTINWFNSKK